ncbi:cupin domain-containing protein [Cytobacillus purgationiresistens]|uniref:Cupin superfamily sugar epimerase n=1 Tax=Cytobacillus purgationiresistens TaxID=863449 RepID=A0ABU0AH74_9BACI|nr:cupin domain-containing protein [Cytobacillus purgationiresistens]MDQ0270587.1 putative cupin superfamily sugar epimerase [Cytobacillus purgationiresistens]
MNKQTANDWIKGLQLEAHPEGGFFRSTFSSEEEITDFNGRFEGQRSLYTSIYFLLRSQDVSHFHRLKSDELWYYHAGSSLTVHLIHENGKYEEIKLGLDIENGEVPQAKVPKNAIFGSSVMNQNTYSLVGCMVSPGFDFADFELFTQDELLAQYPQHEEVIRKLTYTELP